MKFLIAILLFANSAFAVNQGVQSPILIPGSVKGSVVDFFVAADGRGCLNVWPRLLVAADANVQAPFGVITLASGERQLTVNKLPLYFYVGDQKPGDINGEYTEWRPVPVK